MTPKILTFLHSFETGGVERTALRLVRLWQKNGLDAPLWIGRTSGPMRGEFEGELAYESPAGSWFPVAMLETLWMIMRLPAVIRRERPDLLFCPGNSYTIVAVAMKILLGRRCPPIVAKNSNDLLRRDLGPVARCCYHLWLALQGRLIDHFVGMAEPMRDEMRAMLGIDDARISIIADPVLDGIPDCPPVRRHDGNGLRFVAVGRLAPQKDLETMLRAFARGSGPRDSLRIIGDGPLESRLKQMAVRLGLEDRVFFDGHLSDIGEALMQSDLFLMSSRYEGVPAALIEALAAGLPVICTDCAVSIGSIVQGDRFGRIVPVEDAEALAAAIAEAGQLAVDPAAAIYSVRTFTAAESAEHYASLFKLLLPRFNSLRLSAGIVSAGIVHDVPIAARNGVFQ